MITGAGEVRDAARVTQWMQWAGWFLTATAVFVFLWSAYAKLTRQPGYVSEWNRIGYPDSELTGMAVLQLTCLAIYLIPRTSVLGAVLLTGYLGGAIASYVRIGDPYFANAFQVTTALFAWGGLYLREGRLWSLLPLRRNAAR